MLQRGRKSSASNVVSLRPTAARSRLTPPLPLSTAERAIFHHTATQHPHLKAGDAMVLTAFAQAAARSHKLAKRDDTIAWEKAVRAMLALARSLRLTQVSKTRAETLSRMDRRGAASSYYDEMGDDDES
jgi:hypothetical protein